MTWFWDRNFLAHRPPVPTDSPISATRPVWWLRLAVGIGGRSVGVWGFGLKMRGEFIQIHTDWG